MDRLRREHEVGVLLELRVDVVVVPIAWYDAGSDALQETGHLPSSGSTFGVTEQTLLSHDRNGVTLRTREGTEDIVPDMSLVSLVRGSTGTVDGQDTDVVS